MNSLLNVLASSLLSVATFSAAAMLTAYTNVSQGATPRAAALVTGDSRAQGALASFIGAFLYSVVAFSALGTGYYANGAMRSCSSSPWPCSAWWPSPFSAGSTNS